MSLGCGMLPSWAQRAIIAFVESFALTSGETWIGVASREGFLPVDRSRSHRGVMRGLGHGGTIALLPGLPLSDGFVWQPARGHGGPGGETEFWLSPARADHRALFERFAQRHLGAPGLDGAGVQIDHLFPRTAGALDGLAYVRMLAIPPAANMAAGRTVERAMAARARAAPGTKRVRHATYVSIGKATGFAGWQSMPDSANSAANRAAVAALFSHLRAFGVPAGVLTSLDAGLTAHTLTRLR